MKRSLKADDGDIGLGDKERLDLDEFLIVGECDLALAGWPSGQSLELRFTCTVDFRLSIGIETCAAFGLDCWNP